MKIFTFVVILSFVIGIPVLAQSQSTGASLSSESTVTSSSSGTTETDSTTRGNVETEFKVEEGGDGTTHTPEWTNPSEGDPGATDEPEENRAGYIKIDDIKGEATEALDPDDDGDSIGTETDLETRAIYVKLGDIKGESDDSGSSAKKPKEIVVVGSKVREAVAAGVEVRGWDPVKKEATMRASDVQSENDLIDFSAGLLAADATLSSIEIAESSIGVEGTHKAKLFGLFTVKMKHRVEVTADPDAAGRVKVRFPWWSFLAKTWISADEIKAAVEAELATEVDREVFRQEFGQTQGSPRHYQILGAILETSATPSLSASVE